VNKQGSGLGDRLKISARDRLFFENQGTQGHFGVSNLNQDKICGVSE
jgi:hypothetical protein